MIYNFNNAAGVFEYLEYQPEFKGRAYLFDGAKVIGNVTLGEDVSVWFNSVIRGDVHYIRIGDRVNIQDLSMLHVTNDKFPLNVGDDVTVGHNVTLHGCTVENGALIGIGAKVLDGSKVGENSLVAAGAVVREGFSVPPETLVAGVPAKVMRALTDEEIDKISSSAGSYVNYAKSYFNL